MSWSLGAKQQNYKISYGPTQRLNGKEDLLEFELTNKVKKY